MGDRSGIEWTDATWNPIRGCSRVSEGCRNCYAERVAHRFSGFGQPYEGLIAKGGQWNGNITLVPEKLEEPLRWRKPRRIFVNSMSDLFHEHVSFKFIEQVFAVMALARQHTFQVLTKRPERMLEWFRSSPAVGGQAVKMGPLWNQRLIGAPDWEEWYRWPLPNVWLGVSVEDQSTADVRIPLLLQTPAAVRWVSAEPLLGPVNLAAAVGCFGRCSHEFCTPLEIDWLVAGGESGPRARPMHPDWVRSLRDQCQAAGVAFHFKQWGEWHPCPNSGGPLPDQPGYAYVGTQAMARVGKKRAGRELDGCTWDQYPLRQ